MGHVPLPRTFTPTVVGKSSERLPGLPELVPPAAPRFWELSTFKGGNHRGRAGTAAGARAAGPGGAECRVGEPLTERPLCPALPDATPPSAARIRAHRACLHPELHPGTILGCEGTGRRSPKVLLWGEVTEVSFGGHMAPSLIWMEKMGVWERCPKEMA